MASTNEYRQRKSVQNLSIQLCLFKFNEFTASYVIDKDYIGETDTRFSLSKCHMCLRLQSHVLNSLMQQLTKSRSYRVCVLAHCRKLLQRDVMLITINEVPDSFAIIDREWSRRTNRLAYEKLQLETVMSYLSTLGGAFSALGDSYTHCAQTAGMISWKQFQIALRLCEPPLAARCKLYMALSLMQQGYLKQARRLIKNQYQIAKEFNDTRLGNMCKGCWAKLKYTKQLRKLQQV